MSNENCVPDTTVKPPSSALLLKVATGTLSLFVINTTWRDLAYEATSDP
jgi:hypothetical protein